MAPNDVRNFRTAYALGEGLGDIGEMIIVVVGDGLIAGNCPDGQQWMIFKTAEWNILPAAKIDHTLRHEQEEFGLMKINHTLLSGLVEKAKLLLEPKGKSHWMERFPLVPEKLGKYAEQSLAVPA